MPCVTPNEAREDALARALAEIIMQLDSNVEHGAFIVRDANGSTLMTPTVTGEGGYIPTYDLLSTVRNSGYNEADIVGFVHYHTLVLR